MDADILDSALNPPPDTLVEAWGDPVDTREYLRDDPNFGALASRNQVYVTSIDDRLDGRFRPVYETEQDLALIRAQSRNLVTLTGVRTCALDALANYTLWTGYTFEAMPENDTDVASIKLAKALQDVLDRFIDENDFCGVVDREIHMRSREDGEAIVAFDEDEIRMGRVLVEFIEPDQLVEPRSPQDLEEWLGIGDEYASCWKFGVHTPANKTWKALGYHIVRDGVGKDWDYYDANRLEHVKRNVTRNAKRGVTDFYEILLDLKREAKLCANMTQGGALQAAIAWIMQGAPGQTQSQLQAIGGQERTALTTNARFLNNGTTSRNVADYPPGSVLKVGAGQQYLPGPMGAERNQGFELVGQYALRRIGVRWNMPEYMISGDASNANYSSSLVAESPFVKAREADQQFYKRHFLSLLWKVVRIHVESGRFAKHGIGRQDMDRLMSLCRIDAECPTVASRDPKVAVDSDKILVDAGIMSDQTWAARNGLDYDKEQKLGALKAPPPVVAGPFGGPPAQPGQNPANPNAQNGRNPQQAASNPAKPGQAATKQPNNIDEFGDPKNVYESKVPESTLTAAVSAALESVESTEEAKAILKSLRENYP